VRVPPAPDAGYPGTARHYSPRSGAEWEGRCSPRSKADHGPRSGAEWGRDAGVSRFPSQNLITIADLGTGSADIPVALACWARTHHRELRIFGVDWAARNLAVASRRVNRTSEVGLLRADAGRLPFTAGSVDFIISSLFLHHLSPQGVVEILQSAFAAARRGIVMSDLVRGWLPLFAFKLVQPVFARNFLTRQDGARSIRRAYTPAELRQLARAAGLPNAKVQAHWPWRMTLVADKIPVSTHGH